MTRLAPIWERGNCVCVYITFNPEKKENMVVSRAGNVV